MPPNARPTTFLLQDHTPFENSITVMLDNQADTDGLSKLNSDNEDWTDVKHSERKKRDRLLDDGVLIKLMKKSDKEGFKRLLLNVSMMAMTVLVLCQLDVFHSTADCSKLTRFVLFMPIYLFYGFQFQCFAFAGQHEFLHRNAFKSKWVNDVCLFVTGVLCFELGVHERVMHKQHHTYTNHIDKDPELTSYYTREQLENPGFRNLPFTRWGYVRQFLDIFTTFKCRVGRIIFSALGMAVDYSGTGWSLKEWSYSAESGIMQTLQYTAVCQIACYVAVFSIFGQSREGLHALMFWWLAPVLCGYPLINYFRNLEHADCEISKDPNCLRNTRSVRSNFIIRTLLWDTNFHSEHHCYPMVPFFNLHKLNNLMYNHVLHNECDHFTTQNWACLKPDGWIAQQKASMDAFAKARRV